MIYHYVYGEFFFFFSFFNTCLLKGSQNKFLELSFFPYFIKKFIFEVEGFWIIIL